MHPATFQININDQGNIVELMTGQLCGNNYKNKYLFVII